MSVTIKTICDGLKRYYESLGAEYDSLFEDFCDDNSFDIDDVIEELGAEPEECMLIDFDEDFPFPTPPKNDASKFQQIIDTIQKCYSNPTISFTVKMPLFDKHLFAITAEELKATKEIYAEQCPVLWNSGMENDGVFLNLLTIGRKHKFDYLQHLVDDYFCSRIKNIHKQFSENEWSKEHSHFRTLKQIRSHIPYKGASDNDEKGPSQPHEMAVGAVRSFGARCCPKLLLSPMIQINDSLESVVKYIHAAVSFIRNLIDDRFKDAAVCPFQLDFCVVSGPPQQIDNKVAFGVQDDDDDDDEDEKNGGFVDCVGDIKGKLDGNKLTYGAGRFAAESDLDIKARVFGEIFDGFVKKLGKAKPAEKKSYPNHRRFVTLIDRRKKDKGKGDATWMYEPPANCRKIPHDVVPEWYINASRTSLLPDMEYGDGSQAEKAENEGGSPNATNEQLAKTNITSSFHCKGALLTLSFIVKEADAVKMYLYWNGQIIRLQASDIKPVFKNIFNLKWRDEQSSNEAFVNGKEIDELIQDIQQKVTDKYYESFLNSYKR